MFGFETLTMSFLDRGPLLTATRFKGEVVGILAAFSVLLVFFGGTSGVFMWSPSLEYSSFSSTSAVTIGESGFC